MKGLSRFSLRDRRGIGGAASFFIVTPVWYFVIGLLIVFAWWFWSIAVNLIGVSQAGAVWSARENGEARRRAVLAAGLGGFAQPYGDAAQYAFTERAVIASVDRSIPVSGLLSPDSLTVRGRTIARIEGFYARPPVGGGWE